MQFIKAILKVREAGWHIETLSILISTHRFKVHKGLSFNWSSASIYVPAFVSQGIKAEQRLVGLLPPN